MTLINDTASPIATLILAHGAGAPMDSEFMTILAEELCRRRIRVVRFEFPYMAQRRTGGRRPPDPTPKLLDAWRDQIQLQQHCQPLFIGGKSMGGRMASLVAVEKLPISGVIAFGYPFHPPGKLDRLRIDHWPDVLCPALVIQGERDSFGTRTEVSTYALPQTLQFYWVKAANHDLKPLKSAGLTHQEAIRLAADAAHKFIEGCL